MELSARAVLITGGRRIGASVAMAMAQRGANVAVVYRSSRAEADATVDAVATLGRRALAIQADLRDPDACRRTVEAAAQAFGRLDVLVNMASLYRSTPLDSLTLDDWETQMAVDLRSAWLCAQVAIPHMRKAGGGRIINFSDWVARSGRPRYTGYLPYYVAKAGVIALTEALALELAADQILVNAIAPGPILAPDESTDEELRSVVRATPLARWGGEAEIAKAVLAVIDSDFMTGETIRIDGGRHIK